MDNREVALLTIAGGVSPVATVLGVSTAIAAYRTHWIVPFFLLFVSPLFAAAGLYLAGSRFGALRTPSWLPTGRERTFGDRVPERYHEEFDPETLGATTDRGDPTAGRLLALGIVYLVSIPVYTAVLWTLFG